MATFTDVATRFKFVMPLRRKSEVYHAIVAALSYVHQPCGEPPALLHSYNAKEILSEAVKESITNSRTAQLGIVPHNPEENRNAERVNRTLMNAVRCVLATSNI